MAYEDALVKGEPVLQMLGYVRKRKGMEGVNRCLGFANTKFSTGYTFEEFKDMDWYSMPHYDAMLEEMERVFPGDEGMFTKACSHFLENMGIMKYFVKFAMTPTQLMNRASKDFNKFYSTGTLTITNKKKGQATVILREFPFSPHWNRSFAGFLEALIQYTTDANSVNCNIKMVDGSGGQQECHFMADWD